MRLRDKVAIVTGAAAGLGHAVAVRFACEGASVVAADIDAAGGARLLQQVKQAGGEGIFLPTDVSREHEVAALVESTLNRYGRIDVLYNNAAVLFHDQDARAHQLSLEIWERTLSVNLRGVFLCAKHAIPAMLQQGGGSIINLGSPTGMTGCAPELTAYSTSKAGIAGLTRMMAAGYARDQIRVNTIVPGTMDTPMNSGLLVDSAARQLYQDAVPMGRLGLPSDIEGLAVFLASDESAYCTGGLFTCDGGLTSA